MCLRRVGLQLVGLVAGVRPLEPQRQDAGDAVEKAGVVELGVAVEVGGGDGAQQHAVGLQHAALALDLGDAAVGGDRGGVDVVADDLLVAGIDEDLADGDILRRGDEAVDERRGDGGGGDAGDPSAPAPQDAADQRRLDFSGRAFGGGGALSRPRRGQGRHFRRYGHFRPHALNSSGVMI